MTAPEIKVEIAFNAGYSTPDFSRVWTDVTDWVELQSLITITNGRQDEMGQADANRLSLTLDNSDGRFTPTNASSPYYPNVRIGRPIRVTATPSGQPASVRFLGFVDEWPVSWEVTDNYAASTITASSQMAFLGMGSELSNVIAETISIGKPTAYWPLAEPEGSGSAADLIGGVRLVRPAGSGIGFGGATGPGTDSQPACAFNGGAPLSAMVPTTTAGGFSVWFSTTVGTQQMIRWGDMLIELISGTLYVTGSSSLISSANLADGLVHNITITWDSGGPSAALHVDGQLDDAEMALFFPAASRQRLEVGRGFTGGMSHLAIFDSYLSLDASDIWLSGHDGFAGEQSPARFVRIATWIDATVATVGMIGVPMTHFDTAGKAAVDAMRVVSETEGGVVFDTPAGVTTFTTRVQRYAVTAAFSVDVAAAEVDAGFEPTFDRSVMVNDLTVTAGDGSTARATNESSRDEYGTVRGTAEVAASVEHAQDVAAWRVNQYGEPRPRIGSLGIRIESWSAAKQSSVLGSGIGSKIDLANLPAQAPPMPSGLFIEGWTETIGLGTHALAFNVSPGELGDVIILDDPVRCLDSTYVIAL